MSTYKAFIAKIDKTEAIPNADRIHTAYVLGEQVVVSKDWKAGKIGLFFPADTQLSHEFCHHNNLYRDSDKNFNPEAKGFFDDNRRVRCQPFLKVKSMGFFCEINALDYLDTEGVTPWEDLGVGYSFDELNGQEICRKYVNPKTKNKAQKNLEKKKKQIQADLFNQHMSTENFNYFGHKIKEGDYLSFHAKVHGTSFRCTNTLVKRKREDFIGKVFEFFGKDLYTEDYEFVAGSRRVDLFEDKKDDQGFHGSNQFRFDVLDMFKPYLEKGVTVYGEIAGFVNGSPIMGVHSTASLKDKSFKKKYGDDMIYSYGCKDHQYRVHVYRVTYTTPSGIEIDLTNDQVIQWCQDRGFNGPLPVHQSFIYDGNKETLEKLVNELTEREDLLTEDYIDPSHISEGIIVRVDNGYMKPVFYKSKSYAFRVLEGILKESGEEDIEEAS